MHRWDVCSHRLSAAGAKFGFSFPFFFFLRRLTLRLTLPPPHPPPSSPGCVEMYCMPLHNFFLNYLNVVHLHSETAKKSMSTEWESVRRKTESPANQGEECEGGGEPLMNESSLGSMKAKREKNIWRISRSRSMAVAILSKQPLLLLAKCNKVTS